MISEKNGLPQKGKETVLRRHNSGNANRIPKCEKPSTIRPEKPEPALPRSRSKERALLQGIPKHRPHRDFHDSVSLQTQSQAHRGVRPLGTPGLASGGRGRGEARTPSRGLARAPFTPPTTLQAGRLPRKRGLGRPETRRETPDLLEPPSRRGGSERATSPLSLLIPFPKAFTLTGPSVRLPIDPLPAEIGRGHLFKGILEGRHTRKESGPAAQRCPGSRRGAHLPADRRQGSPHLPNKESSCPLAPVLATSPHASRLPRRGQTRSPRPRELGPGQSPPSEKSPHAARFREETRGNEKHI